MASSSSCKNICLHSSAAVLLRAEHTMSTLYPLDHRGPYLALSAATFTVLCLHFSPLATFDALGPSFLSLLCVLFFHLCRFPSEPPLCLSAAVPLPHSLCLPSPWFVEVELLSAWELVPYKLPTPTVRSVQAGQTPRPPLPPFLSFTASI